MEVNMKEIGVKVSIMEKDYTKLVMVLDMMENGIMENTMELVLLFGLMEVFIKENGKIVEKMVKVNSQE